MSPIIGRVLDGRYVISELLGRGGMGVVYLARQVDPPRDVVVKMISPSLRDEAEAILRFEREAKRLQELHHPNIVRFYGYGCEEELAFLVMEYVDGEALAEVLKRKGKFAFPEFVPIASQILKGVGHVHSRDVLLRDIKPSNIMLCERQGRGNFVKLLDFGLAKVDNETQITKGYVLGTAGYIAPEVLRGEQLDLRSDVYALGVLFYLMLAGRLPFDAREQAAIFSQTLHATPPHLSTLVNDPSIPRGFLDLIHRCLEKEPSRRPGDANAVVEEMIDVVPATLFRLPRVTREQSGRSDTDSDIFAHMRLSSRATPQAAEDPVIALPEPLPPTRRRSPLVAGTVAITGILAATIGLAVMMSGGDPEPEVPVAGLPLPELPALHDRSAVSERLRTAEMAAARGDAQVAMEAYLDVLELDPDHALARSGLARVREMIRPTTSSGAGSPANGAGVAGPSASEDASHGPARRPARKRADASRKKSASSSTASEPAEPESGGRTKRRLLSSGKNARGGALLPIN